ncbi:hypothetical protein ABIG04_010252 [Bradyrhizobium japonicum]
MTRKSVPFTNPYSVKHDTKYVWVGSTCEELNLSKSSPQCLTEQTSLGRAAISLMGHERDTCQAS